MSAIQELWRNSYLDFLCRDINRGLAERSAKIVCGIGPEADARAAAPPSITWVDGDGTNETYREPEFQPAEGHAIWDAMQRIEVVIRGATVAATEALRETLFGVLYDTFSSSAVRPINGSREGGGQSEEGFTIRANIDIRWQLLRERWMRDVELTGVDATGQLVGHGGTSPETIVEQETP